MLDLSFSQLFMVTFWLNTPLLSLLLSSYYFQNFLPNFLSPFTQYHTIVNGPSGHYNGRGWASFRYYYISHKREQTDSETTQVSFLISFSSNGSIDDVTGKRQGGICLKNIYIHLLLSWRWSKWTSVCVYWHTQATSSQQENTFVLFILLIL